MIKFYGFVVAMSIGLAQIATPAVAQEFPKKQPVKIVVAFNPGGLTDNAAILIGNKIALGNGNNWAFGGIGQDEITAGNGNNVVPFDRVHAFVATDRPLVEHHPEPETSVEMPDALLRLAEVVFLAAGLEGSTTVGGAGGGALGAEAGAAALAKDEIEAAGN